jgi:hypothetical protein
MSASRHPFDPDRIHAAYEPTPPPDDWRGVLWEVTWFLVAGGLGVAACGAFAILLTDLIIWLWPR